MKTMKTFDQFLNESTKDKHIDNINKVLRVFDEYDHKSRFKEFDVNLVSDVYQVTYITQDDRKYRNINVIRKMLRKYQNSNDIKISLYYSHRDADNDNIVFNEI